MVPSGLYVLLQSSRHQLRIRKEMRRLWVTWAVIVSCGLSGGAADSYQDEPLHYIALQGDLNVAVDSRENLTGARVLNKANGSAVAEWRRSADGDQEKNVTFPCGVINRAGFYTVQLQHNDDRWIDHQELRVSWPPILVQAPEELVNYRTPFQVKIQWLHLKCYPPRDANITIIAQVVHCGRRGNSSFSHNCTAPSVRASRSIPNIWQTGGMGVDILFDCQDLDHLGYYRIFVRAVREDTGEETEDEDDDGIIGSSESIQVHLNGDFQLQVRAKFALPCRRELPVFYRRPSCLTGSQDRVRLYGKTYLSNISSDDFTLKYIGEKVLDPNRSVAALSCRLLDGTADFDSFCFHLVTLAQTDGAVVDISQTYRQEGRAENLEPSGLGPCSIHSQTSPYIWVCISFPGTGVGYLECVLVMYVAELRIQGRPLSLPLLRSAFSATRRFILRGKLKQGQPIESVSCEAPSCPQKEKTDKSVELEKQDGPAIGNLTSECMCGCTMQLGDGTFSLVVSSTLCPSGYITWVFTSFGLPCRRSTDNPRWNFCLFSFDRVAE